MDILSINDLKKEQADLDYFKSLYEGKSDISISFEYESNFENTKFLRDYVLYLLEIVGVNSIWQRRFILIVDELNNNSIEYGSLKNSLNILKFNITKNESNIFLNVEVLDNGNGKCPKNSNEMEEIRKNKLSQGFENHKSIRGRGLFMIINRLVDKLYFKDRENLGLIIGIDKILKKGKDF